MQNFSKPRGFNNNQGGMPDFGQAVLQAYALRKQKAEAEEYRKAQEEAQKRASDQGLFGGLGNLIGGGLGFLVGGPLGASIGSQLGGFAGQSAVSGEGTRTPQINLNVQDLFKLYDTAKTSQPTSTARPFYPDQGFGIGVNNQPRIRERLF